MVWLAQRMITAREIDPADEPLFDSWYAALRAGAVADRSAAILVSHETLAYSLRNPGPFKTRLAVAAFDDDRLVGAMLLEYRLQDNLDTVEVEIDVPVEERRRGVGTALWRRASGGAVAADPSGRRRVAGISPDLLGGCLPC